MLTLPLNPKYFFVGKRSALTVQDFINQDIKHEIAPHHHFNFNFGHKDHIHHEFDHEIDIDHEFEFDDNLHHENDHEETVHHEDDIHDELEHEEDSHNEFAHLQHYLDYFNFTPCKYF